jgi:hypothetical protein
LADAAYFFSRALCVAFARFTSTAVAIVVRLVFFCGLFFSFNERRVKDGRDMESQGALRNEIKKEIVLHVDFFFVCVLRLELYMHYTHFFSFNLGLQPTVQKTSTEVHSADCLLSTYLSKSLAVIDQFIDVYISLKSGVNQRLLIH